MTNNYCMGCKLDLENQMGHYGGCIDFVDNESEIVNEKGSKLERKDALNNDCSTHFKNLNIDIDDFLILINNASYDTLYKLCVKNNCLPKINSEYILRKLLGSNYYDNSHSLDYYKKISFSNLKEDSHKAIRLGFFKSIIDEYDLKLKLFELYR